VVTKQLASFWKESEGYYLHLPLCSASSFQADATPRLQFQDS
jgi:hypothetical protein